MIADVWSKKLFQLDDNGYMLYESGCPPCEFNIDGQHWGMPVYNWSEHIDSILIGGKIDLEECSICLIVFVLTLLGFERYFSIPIGKTKKVFNKISRKVVFIN